MFCSSTRQRNRSRGPPTYLQQSAPSTPNYTSNRQHPPQRANESWCLGNLISKDDRGYSLRSDEVKVPRHQRQASAASASAFSVAPSGLQSRFRYISHSQTNQRGKGEAARKACWRRHFVLEGTTFSFTLSHTTADARDPRDPVPYKGPYYILVRYDVSPQTWSRTWL